MQRQTACTHKGEVQSSAGLMCAPSAACSLLAFLSAEIKATDTVGPVLLHVVTEKGRGYLPAESASDKMHGVVQYDTVTGKQIKAKSQVRQRHHRQIQGTLERSSWRLSPLLSKSVEVGLKLLLSRLS